MPAVLRLKAIGNCAFDEAVAEEIVVPDGVEEIGYGAFSGNPNLRKLSLPNSIVYMGDYPIYEWDGINHPYDKTIYYRGTIEDWTNIELYDRSVEDAFTVQFEEGSISEAAKGYELYLLCLRGENPTGLVISGYSGDETELAIPSKISGWDVIQINAGLNEDNQPAFGRLVKKIVVPDSVTTIGGGVFANMKSLEEVYLGNGVSQIEVGTFRECQSLRKVVLGDSVSDIGDSAFVGCTDLEEIEIGANVKTIGATAFRGCTSLAKVTFNGVLTSIGNCAFADCTSLKEVTIPYVAEVGERIFSNCTALETVTIGGGWYRIPYEMFSGCSMLTEVNLPSVSAIGERAFCGCASLTELIIPGVVYVEGDFVINDSSFAGSGVKEIYFPESEVYVDVGEIYWEEYYDDGCC